MKRGEKIKPCDVDKMVGQNIRKYRRLKDMTQEGLGQSLVPSLSYQQIQKYESGASRVYINTLYQIAVALEVDIEDLFPF